MHDVTCTHCGRTVSITPDSPRCTLCGLDLQNLIPASVAAGYFYRRSSELVARGDVPSALAEAERGIVYNESSELRLLAAILCKRLGDIEGVRTHVSAIPVDDRLRSEAEWLLRSQTTHKAAVRPTNDRVVTPKPRIKSSDSPLEDAVYGTDAAPLPVEAVAIQPKLSRSAQWSQRMWGLVAMALVVLAGAMGWLLLSGGPDALLALVPGLGVEIEAAGEARQLAPVTPAPLVLPTPTPNVQPTVPGDLVLDPAAEPMVAAGGATGPASGFDLASALAIGGRADLAALPLLAQIQDGAIRVSGIVTNTADRDAIVQIAERVPGVTGVAAAELLVRVPATYTVQSGDSLWMIAERFYGSDLNRVTELYQLNRESLPSAGSVNAGMTLQLPPFD